MVSANGGTGWLNGPGYRGRIGRSGEIQRMPAGANLVEVTPQMGA